MKRGFSLFFAFLFLILFLNSASALFSNSSTASINLTISKSQKINVIANEFNGLTTDFDQGNEFLEDIQDLTLEKVLFGKIIFAENVNLTENAESPTGGVYDRFVHLDNNVEIGINSIYVNTTNLTSLEKSAVLYIYNLDLSDPQVLKDGVVCDTSICQEISYSGGTFVFSVTGFGESNYSVRETPLTSSSSSSSSTSSSSSSGGSFVPSTTGFSLNPETLRVTLFQGTTIMKKVEIENLGGTTLTGTIQLLGLEKFTVLNNKTFSISSGDSEIVQVDFFASDSENPEVYTGELIFSAAGKIEKIPIILEIKEREPLFDVIVTVQNEEHKVEPGEYANARIEVINMGTLKNIDIILHYAIKNTDGGMLIFRNESLAIEDSLNLIRRLRIPDNANLGNYVFYSKVSYGYITASSADHIKIVKPRWLEKIAILLIILILILLFIYLVIRFSEHRVYSIKSSLKKNFGDNNL